MERNFFLTVQLKLKMFAKDDPKKEIKNQIIILKEKINYFLKQNIKHEHSSKKVRMIAIPNNSKTTKIRR